MLFPPHHFFFFFFSCLTSSNRQFYLFPTCFSPQSFSILLLLREMRHSGRRTLSSLITSGLDLRAAGVECERNRVTRGETVKRGGEGREGRHYPCFTLNSYIYWTVNKSEEKGQRKAEDRCWFHVKTSLPSLKPLEQKEKDLELLQGHKSVRNDKR